MAALRSLERSKESHITLPDGASSLTKEQLIDRIRGNALGDAAGLEAAQHYGSSLDTFSLTNRLADFHRIRFPKGDWTDDTDQMICILESLLMTGGIADQVDIGKRILYWCQNGFPELGDSAGMGLGATVAQVLSQKNFLKDPHKAAQVTWQQIYDRSGQYPLANGAVMRTSIMSIPCFNDLDAMCENTRIAAMVTHYDSRCVASCTAVNTVIAKILSGEFGTSIEDITTEHRAALTDIARKQSVPFFGDKATEYEPELRKYMENPSLSFLNLDEAKAIGYTYKCMGSGFYALWNCTGDFKKTILEIVMQAGDADTNGAVAGAIMGAMLGYSRLPQDWIAQMPHRKWLDEHIDALLRLLGLQ